MGKLEVVFTVGLANPLRLLDIPQESITVSFSDTGNTVHIGPPQILPRGLVGTLPPGAFDILTLRVERECNEAIGTDTTYRNNERLNINRDAARAFFRFFETLRDIESRHHSVAGYPVAPSEDIQSNPLVRSCRAEWKYDGRSIQSMSFGGIGSIQVTEEYWMEAAKKLGEGILVPAYRSFAHDALYFATSGDPPRAIIMACAAWETALREYLGTVAAKKDKAYEVTARGKHPIPALYGSVKIAKGHPLLHDAPKDRRKTVNKLINELPCLRNRLLHLGKRDLPEGKAVEHASAVLDAIEWLFRDA
jgi:hypothetical protein